MGIFSTLGTAYSGLQTSQTAIGVISHNVSNANNPDYTRQRATIQAKTPLHTQPGDVGTGAEVLNITRIHDEFVYKRLSSASSQKEFFDSQQRTLEEVAKYFPDIDNTGIANDMKNYFDAWTSFANNPRDSKQAIAVAEHAQNLSVHIADAKSRLIGVQDAINDRMQPIVEEINRLASDIADINGKITANESNGLNKANDLRDERDKREMALAKLISPTISKDGLKTDMTIDQNLADLTQHYTVQVGGYPLVDGASFHPLVLKSDPNNSSRMFKTIYFETQDYRLIDLSGKLKNGQLGSLLDLRGINVDKATGSPQTGKIQKYIDKLDTLANTLIEGTNAIYAQSAQKSMASNGIMATGTEPLQFLPANLSSGSFDAVVYDVTGKEVARRTINVDVNLDTLTSISTKLNASLDDNKDGSATNDLSAYFQSYFIPSGKDGQFTISPINGADSYGYKIALVDSATSPTNFAGALGLGRFFDGKDASTMALNGVYKEDPTKINAYAAPVQGDNVVANKMLQLQYDDIAFHERGGSVVKNTISGYYSGIATYISADTQTARLNNDTQTAVLSSVQQEFDAISKVSVDEELTNLMKFQSGYSANAKVVTTIDQMINALLGMKQ